MTENELAKIVVDLSLKIHKVLGPGLLESVYEEVMCHELANLGLKFTRQQGIPVVYEDIRMDLGFRADVIIEGKLIVELKSLELRKTVNLPPRPKDTRKCILGIKQKTSKKFSVLVSLWQKSGVPLIDCVNNA